MLSDMDINAIAGTLKLYFRELPEPLLTDRLYPAFMEGIGVWPWVIKVSVSHHRALRKELNFPTWKRWGLKWKSCPAIIWSDIFSSSSQRSQTRQLRRTAWCTSCAPFLTPTSWPSSLCWSTSNGTNTHKHRLSTGQTVRQYRAVRIVTPLIFFCPSLLLVIKLYIFVCPFQKMFKPLKFMLLFKELFSKSIFLYKIQRIPSASHLIHSSSDLFCPEAWNCFSCAENDIFLNFL